MNHVDRGDLGSAPTKPGWYVCTVGGIGLWWCGTVEKVLARRSDQQWSVRGSEATCYEDEADAVHAVFVLGPQPEIHGEANYISDMKIIRID